MDPDEPVGAAVADAAELDGAASDVGIGVGVGVTSLRPELTVHLYMLIYFCTETVALAGRLLVLNPL